MSSDNIDYSDLSDRLEETNAMMLFPDILGHPDEQPTYREIEFLNPQMGNSELMAALATLEEEGILEVITLQEENRTDSEPHEFYSLTIRGRVIADYFGFLDEQDEMKEALASIELPEDIQQLQDAARPPL